MERPFVSDKISEFVEIRTFLSSISEEELKWHWDEEDRNRSSRKDRLDVSVR